MFNDEKILFQHDDRLCTVNEAAHLLRFNPRTVRRLIREGRGGLVCLNSAARFDKWNHAAVR